MRYLELDEVIRIHERAIRQYGSSLEMRDLGLLESALATPKQTMFGDDLYPDLASKAAILLYLLIKNHPFVDGNKRTGFLCVLRFLEVNGYGLAASDDELYQFTLDVATSVMDKDAIGAWIRAYLKAIE
jgi:death-on-curing protein